MYDGFWKILQYNFRCWFERVLILYNYNFVTILHYKLIFVYNTITDKTTDRMIAVKSLRTSFINTTLRSELIDGTTLHHKNEATLPQNMLIVIVSSISVIIIVLLLIVIYLKFIRNNSKVRIPVSISDDHTRQQRQTSVNYYNAYAEIADVPVIGNANTDVTQHVVLTNITPTSDQQYVMNQHQLNEYSRNDAVPNILLQYRNTPSDQHSNCHRNTREFYEKYENLADLSETRNANSNADLSIAYHDRNATLDQRTYPQGKKRDLTYNEYDEISELSEIKQTDEQAVQNIVPQDR